MLKCFFCHLQFRPGDWVNPVPQENGSEVNNYHDRCFGDTVQGRLGYSYPKGRYQYGSEQVTTPDFIAQRFTNVQ